MKKFILLLDGMMGAGKTTTSNLLSDKLPRTAVIGMDKVKRFVSDFERNQNDNGIARSIVLEMAKKYLDLGLSVVVEQPFRSAEEVANYEKLAESNSVPCYKFQLYTDPDVAYERIIERQKDRSNKVPEDRIRRNLSLYEDRTYLGFEVVDTTKQTPEDVSAMILERIA